MRRMWPSPRDLLVGGPHDLSITGASRLQGVEPSHQLRVPLPTWWSPGLRGWIDLLERFSFRLQIGTCVVIGGVQSRMTEPVPDHGHIDTGGDELNADAVAPGVRRDALGRERRHMSGRCQDVLLELEADPCRTKGLTVPVDEDRFVAQARLSFQQRLE
jgi:hypothetical protein